VEECYEFARDAFDYADRFQTPVFVLSDLDLGMNLWMTPSFKYPDKPFDRGKVLSKEDLERLAGEWGRYRDVDGDAVTYRTLPVISMFTSCSRMAMTRCSISSGTTCRPSCLTARRRSATTTASRFTL